MTNRVVTGFFDACRQMSRSINSIMVQGTTMMTTCADNINFYTGSGSSFSYLSFLSTSLTAPKGVWVDLNNQLVITDYGYYAIRS